jgi:predicted transcriptional regulator
MSTLSLRLPDSLHRRVRELASAEGISINQFVATAVAEKMSALLTEQYLYERASRGDRSKYEAALSKVPDVEPEERDLL